MRHPWRAVPMTSSINRDITHQHMSALFSLSPHWSLNAAWLTHLESHYNFPWLNEWVTCSNPPEDDEPTVTCFQEHCKCWLVKFTRVLYGKLSPHCLVFIAQIDSGVRLKAQRGNKSGSGRWVTAMFWKIVFGWKQWRRLWAYWLIVL